MDTYKSITGGDWFEPRSGVRHSFAHIVGRRGDGLRILLKCTGLPAYISVSDRLAHSHDSGTGGSLAGSPGPFPRWAGVTLTLIVVVGGTLSLLIYLASRIVMELTNLAELSSSVFQSGEPVRVGYFHSGKQRTD